ncbi:unnamed protein product, partial [Polarella glacialis]
LAHDATSASSSKHGVFLRSFFELCSDGGRQGGRLRVDGGRRSICEKAKRRLRPSVCSVLQFRAGAGAE